MIYRRIGRWPRVGAWRPARTRYDVRWFIGISCLDPASSLACRVALSCCPLRSCDLIQLLWRHRHFSFPGEGLVRAPVTSGGQATLEGACYRCMALLERVSLIVKCYAMLHDRYMYTLPMILGNCEGTVSLVPGRRARVFV